MQLIHSVSELRVRLASERSIAFVPTMGNLHAGHLDLVKQARTLGRCVVVSIFVNPLQFGPNEDFRQYPRTLPEDCRQLEAWADVVFAPGIAEMYPENQSVFIELPPLADELCGALRPGHFRGMATVVLKLLNLVQPQFAVFGKKDYQQLRIVQKMAAQLNLQVEIVGGETVRASDGLALSSRNQYLMPDERKEAARLHETLVRTAAGLRTGETDFRTLEQRAQLELTQHGWQVDYVAIRTPADLALPRSGDREWVVLAAARLGKTRLIDNLEICL